ncbi:type II toxin-antitoxin system Phd/YefM family antitoxin [Brevundimonas sp.]|jgi:prevent-host-death family protein|uniref:type II toxin-antitoxin system Phd/YefM family antitoxin n=1 Tax=Brevundimonas sp. TaxID=1871086 RepID=UPI0017A13880|nr:type II toxin-antitoxin system Phd/YefM family antitoxin [Brevundimonas sp.]MBA4807543.1 type II toxin-antitoxin system Phd/YefM family antitoxin [Brevundimonas sp.]
MAAYSVAEAKNSLPRLLDKAIEGEKVIITRHGKPVAEIRSLPTLTPDERKAKLLEIADRRLSRPPLDMTSVELINGMYEEPAE